MLKKAVLLKRRMIRSSDPGEAVTAGPWQEGGSETTDNAFMGE